MTRMFSYLSRLPGAPLSWVLLFLILVSSGLLLLREELEAEEPGSTLLYVADTGANRVRSLDDSGLWAPRDPIRGIGEWTFDRPEAVAVDANGTVYVADTDHNLIRVFASDGELLDSWGVSGTEPGELRGPRGVAVTPDGIIVVADSSNNRVQFFESDGTFIKVVGDQGDAPGQFRQPQFVTVAANGNIVVADHLNDRIQVLDADGEFIRVIGGAGILDRPEGVAVSGAGDVYVTDWGHRVLRFSGEGDLLAEWGRFGIRAGEFVYPAGLATDRCGSVWVADWGNHRIQRFDDFGNHISTFGDPDWWTGEFLYPSAIAIVESGSGCDQEALSALVSTGDEDAVVQEISEEPAGQGELGPDGHFTEIRFAADGTPHLIPLSEIQSGGAGRDGIPAISRPEFVGAEGWEALDYRDDGLVIGVEVNGVRRGYPFQILDWHEIVNDEIGGAPVAVTYCPLCGSGLAFVRQIDGQTVEFGVSGQLYNSDLLMYDRFSDTLWSQLTGTAVVGELTGTELEIVPVEILTWRDWREAYPDSEVLTRNTGYSRPYDSFLYGDYADKNQLLFPVKERNTTFPAKERITGVELTSESFGAYADRLVVESGAVNDTVDGKPLLVIADPNAGNNVVVFERETNEGSLTFDIEDGVLVDRETGSHWSYDGLAEAGPLTGTQLAEVESVKSFWFAWFAFHPGTAVWTP